MKVFFKEERFNFIPLFIRIDSIQIGNKGEIGKNRVVYTINDEYSLLYRKDGVLHYYYPKSSLVRNEDHDRLVCRIISILSSEHSETIIAVDPYDNSTLMYNSVEANHYLCFKHIKDCNSY